MSSIDYTQEGSVVVGKPALRSLDEIISKPLDSKPDKKFYFALMITWTMLTIGGLGLAASLFWGTGLWGNNNPVGWGLPIVNFVFYSSDINKICLLKKNSSFLFADINRMKIA